ncbi:myosin-11 [Patella vulgata]|uniref:myosin-11 n=1 Tax=Patella vulgata TaxID=6465 RepID=UPI0024A9A751|nr:myosin-11 [Patella vulgata]
MEDLKCKLQLTLEELSKSKSVIDQTLGENKDLVNKLTLSGQLDHDYTLLKQDLKNTLDDKSKLEKTVKNLEQKLFEQMQQADDEFEEERAQRIDLEKKLCEYSDLETEIFTVREELENEKREKLELKQSLQEYEDLLEDQKTEHENVQLDLEAKVKCLEKRSQELQDDLFSVQDELQIAIDNTEKANKELEVTKVELSERLSIQPQSIKSVHSAIPVRCNGNIIENNKSNKDVESSSPTKLSPSLENQKMPSHMFSDKIEAVTLELTTSKKHLEETLEDVELYKTKLEQLELELDSSHEKLVQSQTAVEQLQNQNEQLLIQKEQLQSQKGQLQELINMGKDETDMVSPEKPVENDLPVQNLQMAQSLLLAEKQVMEMQTTLEVTKSELCETKDKLKAVELEYCALKTSIDHKQTTSLYDVEEKQQHLDRIKLLEEISRQLELDNREMAKKLSETLSQTEDIETKLERERQRNSDNNNLGTRHSRQLEEELDTATKQIRTLREDLHEEQAKVFRLEAENVGQKAKYDSIVTRLETEVADMKEFHRKEMDSLTNKLEASNTEAQELRSQIRDKEQELLNQETETARMKSSLDRVEAQVETEIKLRTNMENRNKQQEQEMTKVWAQVRTMMEKCSKLENTKHCLEEELSRLMSSTRQAETIFIQKSASQESNITSLEMRTEQAERKNEKLQRDLDDACKNLKTMEEKVQNTESSHLQLEDQQDFIVKLRNQLESERLQRTLSDQNVAELRHQVTLLKQRESKLSAENRELQHTILDLESRITYLQDEKENDYDMKHQMSESGKQNLMSQIVNLREEVKILQYELLSANEKQEMHEKRYENRKLRTKEKLLKAREYYSTERSRLRDQMEVMDEELRLSRATLRKEAEWRDKMDANYKHILQEKRELITNAMDYLQVDGSGGDVTRPNPDSIHVTSPHATYRRREFPFTSTSRISE